MADKTVACLQNILASANIQNLANLPTCAIGLPARDQWMAEMSLAMKLVGIAPEVREALQGALFRTADWMRNQPKAD